MHHVSLTSKWRKTGRKKSASKLGGITLAALCILIAIILITLLAPLLAPHDPYAQDLNNSLKGPQPGYPLGFDKAGRDELSRLIYGGRTTLLGALLVVGISLVIGLPMGLFSGYYGGKADMLLMRLSDMILAFPSLLLAFVFVAAFGTGLQNTIIALGIVYIPAIARLTRSLALVERAKPYVECARSLGYSDLRILFRHILPNCVSTITVQVTLDLAYAILDIASMSFIGLGISPPTADWGAMLAEARIYVLSSPALAVYPGLAIIVTVVALNLFSDGLQAYWDPKERKVPKFKKEEALQHA